MWHKRLQPREHGFKYNVFMMYIDLSEVDEVLTRSRFWSRGWFSLARFKRSDYFSSDQDPAGVNTDDDVGHLDKSVRETVNSSLSFYPDGPIRLLTNFRYFGHIINPISCYYCFSKENELNALLIEVTNTPWGEKTHYVLDLRGHVPTDRIEFDKKMHVSPFMPMKMMYQWRGNITSDSLHYSLANLPIASENEFVSQKSAVFHAGVNLNRLEITSANLNRIILHYPFMTLKVAAGIYWQALRLAIKRVPFLSHPDRAL